MSAVIQRVDAGFTASPLVMTLTGCVAGSIVTVSALHSYAGTPPGATITNTTGLTKNVNNAGGGPIYGHSWTATVAANGNCVITLTYAAGNVFVALAAEMSGLDATTPHGGHSVSTQANTAVSAGTVTPTVDGSYLQYLGGGVSVSWTPPSGFTEVRDDVNFTAADLVQATAAAINPAATATTADATNTGFVVYFNAAAGGGGGGTKRKGTIAQHARPSTSRSRARTVVSSGRSLIYVPPLPGYFGNAPVNPTVTLRPLVRANVRFRPRS